ncbi:MAG TPA: SDR family NAD(P)-dependent oxidoreductase [Caulobacterales bacterium]|nr:SDR family NAD(P)-dependent oxidoreductase [Caulobacterales bacterium]
MSPQISLDGRRALVTGAAGGLGAAFARKLASAGANIVMSGLESASELEAVRRDIAKSSDVRVDYVRADLSSLEDIEKLTKRVADKIGRVDILVNNAVVRHFAPIDKFPVDRWTAALAVNVSAPFHLTRLLLPGMRASGYGRIFNITSVYGSRGTANRVDYVTSKSAIEGLTRATAMESPEGDVTCHALCPGSVLTPSLEQRIRKLGEDENLDWERAQAAFLQGKQPSGRFVEASSVAEVLLMLCGPVGRDMNGAIIPIEGGWLARA